MTHDRYMTTVSTRVPIADRARLLVYAQNQGFHSVSEYLRHVILSKLERANSTDSTQSVYRAMESIRQAQESLRTLLEDEERRQPQGVEKVEKPANKEVSP